MRLAATLAALGALLLLAGCKGEDNADVFGDPKSTGTEASSTSGAASSTPGGGGAGGAGLPGTGATAE